MLTLQAVAHPKVVPPRSAVAVNVVAVTVVVNVVAATGVGAPPHAVGGKS